MLRSLCIAGPVFRAGLAADDAQHRQAGVACGQSERTEQGRGWILMLSKTRIALTPLSNQVRQRTVPAAASRRLRRIAGARGCRSGSSHRQSRHRDRPGKADFERRERNAVRSAPAFVRAPDPGMPQTIPGLEGFDVKAVIVHSPIPGICERSGKHVVVKTDVNSFTLSGFCYAAGAKAGSGVTCTGAASRTTMAPGDCRKPPRAGSVIPLCCLF